MEGVSKMAGIEKRDPSSHEADSPGYPAIAPVPLSLKAESGIRFQLASLGNRSIKHPYFP